MSAYRKTRTPGVYVRHENGCPAAKKDGPRCRCSPSYRSRRRDLGWSPTFKDRNAAIEWKASATATAAQPEESTLTFGSLAREWWAGVESGAVSKRKGRKGDGYSETTLADYRRSLFNVLLPTFENDPAESLDEKRWQAWVDKLSREGLSRSRIATHLAVSSAIYGWGSRATRGLVSRNPIKAVELPPNDERKRERVATAEEAAELLAALPDDVRVPYAIAFYAGLRRSEINRLEWRDVDLEELTITVRVSKSEAGTLRRVPIAELLVPILKAAKVKGSIPKVCTRSVMSGKLAEAARKAWATCPYCGAGWVDLAEGSTEMVRCELCDGTGKRKPPLQPIGLHECRHTYASLLMAAGYNSKELMEYLGHADLTTTSRYVKRLPQPAEAKAADKLNRYLKDAA